MKKNILSGKFTGLLVMGLVLSLLLGGCGKSGQDGADSQTAGTLPEGACICGVDVSGMTPEEAKSALQAAADAYSINVTLDQVQFVMTGPQLGITVAEDADWETIETELQEDPEYAPAVFTLNDQDTVQTAMLEAYTAASLQQAEEEAAAEAETADAAEEAAADAEAQPEETLVRDVTRASIQYDETAAAFIGVDGQPGEALDYSNAAQNLITAASLLEESVLLESEMAPSDGEKADSSEEVKAALEEANAYLKTEISITFTPKNGTAATEQIPASVIAEWMVVQADGLTVEFDTDVMSSWLSQLASNHKVKASGSVGEQNVDTNALYQAVLEKLQNKESATIEAVYKESDPETDKSGDYIDIDLTSQTVTMYKGGKVIVSASCVTGCVAKGHATPTGTYYIFSMDKDRYLTGNGYKSWVNYFMPFNGGIGLHDASWRSSFGGSIYLYSGSHGCVNMPYSAVQKIYNNAYIGYKVVVHGGISKLSDALTPSWSGSAATAMTEGETASISYKSSSGGSLSYSSADSTIVSVDSKGTMTAVKAGSTTITVTTAATGVYLSSTKSFTVTVTAKSKTAQSLGLSAGSSSLNTGDTTQISVSGAKTSVTYSSSDTSVATVDASGKVTAVGAGTATITAKAAEDSTYQAASAGITITVTEPQPTEPETQEPETQEPETQEPETQEPETQEPETQEPETQVTES